MNFNLFGKLENIIPVNADGGIANPELLDGRIIPVIIVDCKEHAEVIDFCHLQKATPPGDVRSTWAWELLNKRYVYLRLEFLKPVQTSLTLKFDVRTQGGIVCGILQCHALYLQPTAFGKKITDGLGQPKVLIEIPEKVVPVQWYANFQGQLVKRFKKIGYNKANANQSAKEYVRRAKETWELRIPRKPHDKE